MVRGIMGLVVALGIAGCGDDAQPGCDPDLGCAAGTGSSSGDGGSGDGPATSISASSTSADTATSSVDGTAAATSEATSVDTGESSGGDADGTTTGGGSSEGDVSGSSTGDMGNVVYSAQALIGALDRILVFREDLDEDRCTWIVLVSPGFASPYDVTTPDGWSIESIQANDVGAACGTQTPAMFGSEPATAADGTVELGPVGAGGVYPCDVTVDVTAMFAGILPSVPPSDLLDATAIPVTGC